jgi:hypothetical protein
MPYLRAVLAACLLAHVACSEDKGPIVLSTGDVTPTARLTLELMDAPFPLELISSTRVSIIRIAVHTRAGDDDSPGLQTIRRRERTLDLLDLRNGVTESLLDDDVPVGSLVEVRLFVEEATVTLADGRAVGVILPSDLENGIPAVPTSRIEVAGPGTTELLLDFDLSRSLVPIPRAADELHEIRHFLLQPALRVVNRASTGSVSGSVFDNAGTPGTIDDDIPLSAATVMAYLGIREVTGTATAPDGSYKLMGLEGSRHRIVVFARGFHPDTLRVTVMTEQNTGGNNFRLRQARSSQ